MYTNKTFCSLFAIILFITTIIVVSSHGRHNRIIAQNSSTHVIESSEQAYRIWEEKKVKGRILLLFDNYPHSRGLINYNGIPQLTTSNFVEFSVFKNILRKIYFIVPDNRWGEFLQQNKIMNPIREFMGAERGMYLFNINGTPLIAVPLSSIPHIPEKPLVYINTAVFNHDSTLEQLSLRKITSDCIISLQSTIR